MIQNSLRPVGQLLGDSFSGLGSRWLTLSLLFVAGMFTALFSFALVYVLGVVFVGFIQGWENLGRVVMDPRRLQLFLEESQGALTILNLLAFFIVMRVYCKFLAAAIHASSDESLGFRESLKKAKNRGYAFLALVIVQQVILQIGMMLFILPGIILAVLLGFAFWAFVRDDAGVFQSLGNSVRLVKGHFFGVFGRMILLGLIGAAMMIVPVLGWLIGPAWIMVAWSLMYEDLREPTQPTARSARPPQVAGRVAA
jgi:hypothetical protein